jgi:tetratricopeptide (TPR) repeat protein
MTLQLDFEPSLQRWLLVLGVGVLGGWLASASLLHFTVAALTDPSIGASRELLESAVSYFPNASKLHARLAANLVESQIDQQQDHAQLAALAGAHLHTAIRLAPSQFDHYVLLAVVAEQQDDLAGARAALQHALQLAPHRLSLHWRLGNLQLRMGQLTEAAQVFARIVKANPAYLPEALSLLWQAGDGQLALLTTLAGEVPAQQLALANFLAGQEQYEAATSIFAGLLRAQPASAAALPQAGELLTRLLGAGQYAMAAQLWTGLGANTQPWGPGAIWNGGFERPLQLGFSQFDWNFSVNPRVRVGITNESAQQGQASLKLVYLGKETTRLEHEVRQLVLLAPGVHYRLECLVKTESLQAPDGPQIALLRVSDQTVLAASPVIANGTRDWQPLRVEFTAPPAGLTPAWVTLRQIPQFSYTEPTHGTVWFDEFRLTALAGKSAGQNTDATPH